MYEEIVKLKELIFSLFLIAFGFFILTNEARDIISDIDFVKNGIYAIATVQKVTQMTRASRHSKETYSVEVIFEQNGEEVSKKFVVAKSFADKVGDYFDTKYRVGNKVAILVNKNGKIMHYADRKSVFFEHAGKIVFSLLFLAVGIVCLVYPLDSEKGEKAKKQKKSFYFQDKKFKIKNLSADAVDTMDYLKKIENGELICFGFSVGEGFCEYSYEKNVYFERIDDGKEEVTHEITERSTVERRIKEISQLAKKYT